MSSRRFWLDLLLALISGLLLSAAHPISWPAIETQEAFILNTEWQWPLAWFGLVPFLFVLTRRTGLAAFGMAYVLSAVYFFISIFWINIAIVVYGHILPFYSILITGLLSLIMSFSWSFGLYWGVTFHQRFKLPLGLCLGVTMTAWELVRNYLFSGYPWQNLGYSQYLNLPILQTASIWSIYGLTFILFFFNGVIFDLIRWRLRPSIFIFPQRQIIAAVSILLFCLGFGYYRIASNDEATLAAPKLKVAMIQGNIDQNIKNESKQHARKILDVYWGLSKQIPADVDLVVWPEAAFPYSLPHQMKEASRIVENRFPEGRLPWKMLIGSSTYERIIERQTTHYHNSSLLIERNLEISGSFSKSHLVPFGEYVPLPDFLPIEKIVPEVGSFYPGVLGQGLTFNGSHRLGVLICYEGIFPEIAREYARVGVSFLVNLTNDAWYGVSAAPYQHLAFYSFRAVEAGKAVLRAANTGISTTIDSSGRINANRSTIFTRTAIVDEIPLLTERTLYSYIGDIPAYGCLALWLVGMGLLVREHRKAAPVRSKSAKTKK